MVRYLDNDSLEEEYLEVEKLIDNITDDAICVCYKDIETKVMSSLKKLFGSDCSDEELNEMLVNLK